MNSRTVRTAGTSKRRPTKSRMRTRTTVPKDRTKRPVRAVHRVIRTTPTRVRKGARGRPKRTTLTTAKRAQVAIMNPTNRAIRAPRMTPVIRAEPTALMTRTEPGIPRTRVRQPIPTIPTIPTTPTALMAKTRRSPNRTTPRMGHRSPNPKPSLPMVMRKLFVEPLLEIGRPMEAA